MADVNIDVNYQTRLTDENVKSEISKLTDKIKDYQRRLSTATATEQRRLTENIGRLTQQKALWEQLRDGVISYEEAARKISTIRYSSTLDALQNDIDGVVQRMESAANTADPFALRSAARNAEELRERINAVISAIQQDASIAPELRTSMTETLNQFSTRLSESAAETGRQYGTRFRQNTLTKISDISSHLSKTMINSVTGVYNFSKKTVTQWGSYMKHTFNSVISTWKSMLFGIFSPKNTGANDLLGVLSKVTAYISVASLIKLGKEAVELSSDMVEVRNVTNSVFGDMADEIEDFARRSINAFGLTELEATQFAGVYGGMLKAAKLPMSDVTEMSKNLTALTGDISSFYNMDTDEVFKKLQSGLAGNVSAMRTFGVSMTSANLSAYALEKGISKSYETMSESEKTVLRYNYILDSLADAQGDAANTANSWANQIRLLSSQFKLLLSIMGGAVTKVFYPAIVMLNELTASAIAAAQAMAQVFGFDISSIEEMYSIGGTIATDIENMDDYASATDSVADSLYDAGEAAKAASGQLAGFDRLNNVVEKNKDSKQSVKVDITIPDFDYVAPSTKINSYYRQILNSVDNSNNQLSERQQKFIAGLKRFMDDIAGIDYSVLGDAWKELSGEGRQWVNLFGDAIIWLWNRVLLPFWKWSATAGAPSVIGLVADSLTALRSVIQVLSPYLEDLWGTKFEPFLSEKGTNFVNMIARWRKAIKEWTAGLETTDNPIAYLQNSFDGWILSAKTKLYDFIDDTRITGRIDSIGGHVKSMFGKLLDGSASKSAKELVHSFSLLSLIVFDNISGFFDWVVGNEKVSSFVSFLVYEFGELTDFTFDKIEEFIDKLAGSDKARDIIRNIVDLIKKILDYAVDNVDSALNVIDTIVRALDKLATILSSLGIDVDDLFTAFLVLKGVEGAVGLLKWCGELKIALGGLSGSVTSLSSGFGTVASTIATTAAPIAAVIGLLAVWEAGVVKIGAAAQDVAIKHQQMSEDFQSAYTATVSRYDELVAGQNLLFNTDSAVAYANSLRVVMDSYNSLDKKVRESVETGRTTIMTTKKLGEEAIQFATALESVGYTGTDTVARLKELGNIGLNSDLTAEQARELVGIIREVTMAVEQDSATVQSYSDKIADSFATGVREAQDVLANSGLPADIAELIGASKDAVRASGLDEAFVETIDSATEAAVKASTSGGKEVGKALEDSISGGFDSGDIQKTTVDAIGDSISDASSVASDGSVIGSELTDGIVRGVEENAGQISDTISSAVADAVTSASGDGTTESFKDVGKGVVDAIASGVTDSSAYIAEAIAVALGGSVDSIDYTEMGTEICNGVSTSITESTTLIQYAITAALTVAMAGAEIQTETASGIGVGVASGISDGITESYTMIGYALSNAVMTAVDTVSLTLTPDSAIALGTTVASNISSGIATGVTELGASISEGIMSALTYAAAYVMTGSYTLGTAIVSGTVTGVQTGMPQVVSLVQSGVDSAISAGVASGAGGTNIGKTITQSIVNGIRSGSGSIKSMLSSLVKTSTAGIAGMMRTEGYSIGSEIIAGINSGIASGQSAVMSRINAMASAIRSAYRSALRIHSPSGVFADDSEMIPAGVAKGVDDNADTAYKAVIDFADTLSKAFDAQSVDTSSIIDIERLQDELSVMQSMTGSALGVIDGQFASAKFAPSVGDMPSVAVAEQSAFARQQSVTQGTMQELYSAIASQLRYAGGGNGGTVNCNLYLGNEQLARFVIDTVNGNVIQTGGA